MHRSLLLAGFLLLLVPAFASAATSPITRRDGFLLIWQSIGRPADAVTQALFSDVSSGSAGFREITFAERRGILDEAEKFWPAEPLELEDALLWLFRTRSIDDVQKITYDTIPTYLERYPIAHVAGNERMELSEDVLRALLSSLDEKLASESHEVSLYSEKFHGKGTAFGESFNMHAMTAAHRTFPHNTLVEVTNKDNGKTVTVRINDRGPYVDGRDMDLSLGSFLMLSPRSAGVLRNVTFRRLGDAALVLGCGRQPMRQQRITRDVRLLPGVPWTLPLGQSVSWTSTAPYVVLGRTYPDGSSVKLQDWVLPAETYTFTPSIPGTYVFRFGTKEGRRRTMQMTVADCGFTAQ